MLVGARPDWADDFLDASKARLGDVLEDIGTKKLVYLYDFGDGWEHTIMIERLADSEPGMLYPRLTGISGRCPPEDCGGPWGYAELPAAIEDPKSSATADSPNGSGTTSNSPPRWLPSPKAGPERHRANASDAADLLTCGPQRTVTHWWNRRINHSRHKRRRLPILPGR
jgi:hypothetical protein